MKSCPKHPEYRGEKKTRRTSCECPAVFDERLRLQSMSAEAAKKGGAARMGALSEVERRDYAVENSYKAMGRRAVQAWAAVFSTFPLMAEPEDHRYYLAIGAGSDARKQLRKTLRTVSRSEDQVALRDLYVGDVKANQFLAFLKRVVFEEPDRLSLGQPGSIQIVGAVAKGGRLSGRAPRLLLATIRALDLAIQPKEIGLDWTRDLEGRGGRPKKLK